MRAIRRTFIEPFRDWRRTAVFLGTFAGYFGFTLANVSSAYGVGNEGYWAMAAYYGPSLILPSFVLWPLIYMGFRCIDGRGWRVSILGIQALSLATFIAVPHIPLLQGFASGFLAAPFWAAYHIAMVQNTTQENRAFEVSLATFLGITGSVLGTITAGFLLDRDLPTASLIVAFAGLLIGSASVLAATRLRANVRAPVFIREARRVVTENPYLVRRIIMQSLFDMPGFTLATLIHRLDFSAAMTAALLASRVISEFALAPVVGHFVHTKRNRGFGLGMAFVAVSWIFLLLLPHAGLAVIVFMVLYGTGIRFAFNSMISGLYEMQSYASMMWTEVFLGVGRSFGMVCLMPLLYFSTSGYMAALGVLACLLAFLNRTWMRKWKIV